MIIDDEQRKALDPAYHTVLERIARWDHNPYTSEAPRYIALERQCRGGYVGAESPDFDWRNPGKFQWRGEPYDDYSLCGGAHVTLFKTLRNARREIGNDVRSGPRARDQPPKPPGAVFLLDLYRLPVVDADELFTGADLDERQFAERQFALWGERLEDIDRRERLRSNQPVATGK